MARKGRGDEDAILGCLVYLMLIVFLMPLAGIYLLCKPDPHIKLCGAALLIGGLLLWAFAALS